MIARRETLGAIVRKHRTERGWTMAELGRRSGCSESLISYMEKGSRKRYAPSTLAGIARALRLPRDLLLVAAGHPPPWMEKRMLGNPQYFLGVLGRHIEDQT